VYIWCTYASKLIIMTRLSISFTEPNDKWLKEQIESKEYTSKSELVNDLIRRERDRKKEVEWIRAKIEKGLNSGISTMNMEEIRQEALSRING